jgi:hypothetical protein
MLSSKTSIVSPFGPFAAPVEELDDLEVVAEHHHRPGDRHHRGNHADQKIERPFGAAKDELVAFQVFHERLDFRPRLQYQSSTTDAAPP